MRKLALLNVVGLSQSLLPHAPRLAALGPASPLTPVLPALTCSVQSSIITGTPVAQHGIVANGWFDHDYHEIRFWHQSNNLVHGQKLWDLARNREPSFTCANLFWWFNMYSSVDFAVTPRPQYHADGVKLPDIHTHPAPLRDELQSKLGTFPLFNFWGPMSNITSSQWIADAARLTVEQHDPTLTLIYLPHLDYVLQKLGPDHPDIPREVAAIDNIAGRLIDFFNARNTQVIALSEYGIEPARPDGAIFINRHLRNMGLLAIRNESGREYLDAGASAAFAVADHQIAHVYDRSQRPDLRQWLASLPGVDEVTTIDHPRAGQHVLVAKSGHWFTYDYWLDDARAPDFARTVDIHRKPGYDPRELFIDRSRAAIAWKLLRRRLGFRQLLDVIPLDSSLVKGTHGRAKTLPHHRPLLIGPRPASTTPLPCTAVRDIILEAMFD